MPEKNGWVLNPDNKKLEIVIRGLARTKRSLENSTARAGYGAGIRKKMLQSSVPVCTTGTKLQKTEACHCNLYYKE